MKKPKIRGELLSGNFAPTNIDFNLTFTRYYYYKIGPKGHSFIDWLKKFEPRINSDNVRAQIDRQINKLNLDNLNKSQVKDMLVYPEKRFTFLIDQFPFSMNYLDMPKELVCTFLIGYPKTIGKDHFNKQNYIEWILTNQFAGANNSASAIYETGLSIGHFFHLLDDNDNPTEKYKIFYL